ncbi:hypothetical protein RJT34_23191 [Clitoria ternatea]|uniref:E3 ubiquitin-protein ligase n=1 Tax=Clitoria ternatea TaxID=43366 RepID=A0AAN9FND6_CLITE
MKAETTANQYLRLKKAAQPKMESYVIICVCAKSKASDSFRLKKAKIVRSFKLIFVRRGWAPVKVERPKYCKVERLKIGGEASSFPVTERRFCGLTTVESLERELIYKLSIGDVTHSQLVKSLPGDLSKFEGLQDILDTFFYQLIFVLLILFFYAKIQALYHGLLFAVHAHSDSEYLRPMLGCSL